MDREEEEEEEEEKKERKKRKKKERKKEPSPRFTTSSWLGNFASCLLILARDPRK